MIIPVKCFTCGKVLANKYRYYTKEVQKKKINKNIDVEKVQYLTKKKRNPGNPAWYPSPGSGTPWNPMEPCFFFWFHFWQKIAAECWKWHDFDISNLLVVESAVT